jgi:hypothetical protein
VDRVDKRGLARRSQHHPSVGKGSTAAHEQEAYDLVAHVATVLLESPNTVQRHFKRQKHAARRHRQHNQSEYLHSAVRGQTNQVALEFQCARRKILGDELINHPLGRQRLRKVGDRDKEHQEWHKGEDCVCCD